MTDEEKANVYHLNNVTSEEVYYHAGMSEKVRRAYLDGLAEGRTEQRRLQIAYSDVLEKENAELKEQIEKMKNVGNCKYSMVCAEWNEKQTVLGLMKFCLNCKNWELAE